ncbi:hypothetical protein LVJ77_12160 [Conchiformibius kuhniae]|uniref:Roadblock/LC7 domain-containing protein n=2 Tax=Conchiformibius kuhniae TaxID=211502 RepID=A0ABD8B8G9_9NEIS
MVNKLQRVLTEATNSINECVAAGYVDIQTGLLLGVNTLDSHPSAVLELVAAATADLFAGQNVTEIERMFKQARQSSSNRRYFQEIIVNSDNLIHIFIRGQRDENHVAVFVCRNKALLGMVLSQARKMMPALESAA